jgi:hypothetical protein
MVIWRRPNIVRESNLALRGLKHLTNVELTVYNSLFDVATKCSLRIWRRRK